jgi:hypothetical protein
MQRASEIRAAGTWNPATAIDRVELDADERHRRRIALIGERGTKFLLDLPRATTLRDGDGLVLEDGAIVYVAGKPEPVVMAAIAIAVYDNSALLLLPHVSGPLFAQRHLRRAQRGRGRHRMLLASPVRESKGQRPDRARFT